MSGSLLRSLWGDDLPGVVAISSKRDVRDKTEPLLTRRARTLDEAREVAAKLNGKANVWFRVSALSPDVPQNGRGKAADSIALPALYVELDVRDEGAFPTIEAAREFVDQLPLAPSAVVESGGGLHLYWIFHEPWVFDSADERTAAEKLLKRWEAFVIGRAPDGVKVDSVADLARVLRVPLTMNLKYNPPREVVVTDLDDDRRYDPSDFEPFLPAEDERLEPRHSGESTTLPPAEVARVRSALDHLGSAYDRGQWVRVGMALHATGAGDQAYALWAEWSRRSEKFDPRDQQRVWDSFSDPEAVRRATARGPLTIGTLLAEARRSGWVEPSASELPPGPSGECPACGRDSCEGDCGARLRDDARWHDDTGNAARLVRLHGERLRFLHPWKQWIVWEPDAGRWVRDQPGSLARELAKDVGREIKKEAAAIADSKKAERWFKFGCRSMNAGGLSGMVKAAEGVRDVILLDHELLDADGWLLGVANGVVDLRSGALLPPNPALLMTKQAPVTYDPDATCPRWEQALREWHPDAEMRAYFQRLAGASLVGGQRDHRFIIHYGEGGNGKGAANRAFQRALGPYAVEVHKSLLIETRNKEHDTVRASLFRTRLAVAFETERRVRLSEASVKNLTGGDRIPARRMYEDEWSFNPTHSLWLVTNHLPQINGRDEGIWRRIRVCDWEKTFRTEDEPDFEEKLAAEAPGILRWMVEGCIEWQRVGLAEPEAVRRATTRYKSGEDKFAQLIEDVGLKFDEKLEFGAQRLQDEIERWGSQNGLRQSDVYQLKQSVGEELGKRGCDKVKGTVTKRDGTEGRGLVWKGVGVESENGEKNGESGESDEEDGD